MVLGFINWNIDPEIIKLFGVISLRYYGILFVTGLYFGYYIVKHIYLTWTSQNQKGKTLNFTGWNY